MINLINVIAMDLGGVGTAILGASLGAGLAAFAAAWGLSIIAKGNAESIARQPSAAGDIRGTSMLLGFLIEGVALFACVIVLLFGLIVMPGIVDTASNADGGHAPTPVEQPAE